jgi:Flp pilus assembly CpaF family ATPase
MLQAMNTGHEGSMTTIHANSRDAQKRLEQMITWLE